MSTLGAIGKAVGKREKSRVEKKYGIGSSSESSGSSGSGTGGVVSDIIRDKSRKKRASGKSR